MIKNELHKNFSTRLKESMRQAGHITERSGLGLDIKKLARSSKCSYQMARKYIRGESFPEIDVIIKIADWLKIKPSWLLFGEENITFSQNDNIQIKKSLLQYILDRISELCESGNNSKDLASFFFEVIFDTAHLAADETTIMKIIDLMFTSATQLPKFTVVKKCKI